VTSIANRNTAVRNAAVGGDTEVWMDITFKNGIPQQEDHPMPLDPKDWTPYETYVLRNFYFQVSQTSTAFKEGERPCWYKAQDSIDVPRDRAAAGVEIEALANMAKDAWQIIKDGRPSLEIKDNKANAVPKVSDWDKLTGTAPQPVSTTWTISGHNLLGMTLYQFDIQLLWNYDAKYQNMGQYIPNCWVDVPYAYVAWGWNAVLSAKFQNPINTRTAENPLAALPVTTSGTASGIFQNISLSKSYTVLGDGIYY
jgi:hypothetical protein